MQVIARSSSRTLSRRFVRSISSPHGGVIKDSILTDDAAKQEAIAGCTVTFELNDRQLCDTELIMNGAFSPLDGFMSEATYDGVVSDMRIPESNLLFGLPVVLDTDRADMQPGTKVLLQAKGEDIAVLDLTERWTPRKDIETKECYRTTSLEHPGVLMVATERARDYVGGKITGLNLPTRDFPCATPTEQRASLPEDKDVVAFQCRNPIHRAHYELFMRALEAENVGSDGIVLVHPTVGPTQSDDIPGDVRYKTYVVLAEETQEPRVHWAYLPYSMHMAGPREAIQHMMLRKNYGCTHFIIGRDMAGSKSSIDGEDFYGAYDAQEFAQEHSAELGVKCVPSLNLAYTAEEGYVTADIVEAKGLDALKLSGTKFRKMLRAGEDIPEWFAFKSVVNVLREAQK